MASVGAKPETEMQAKQAKHEETNNKYATKKTLAQGLLDVGLMMANASQLKALINAGTGHEYFWALIVLLALSILLQILTGIVLLILGSKNVDDPKDKRFSQILNNFTVGLIFFVTVINVFISAFGIKLSSD